MYNAYQTDWRLLRLVSLAEIPSRFLEPSRIAWFVLETGDQIKSMGLFYFYASLSSGIAYKLVGTQSILMYIDVSTQHYHLVWMGRRVRH